MTRRSNILQPGGLPGSHDGTSQRARALPALDPATARIDERDDAELLRFVQALAKQLRYFSVDAETDELQELGSWSAFAEHPDVSIADIVAYMRTPEAATDKAARWLGRPHFALLLTFLELLQDPSALAACQAEFRARTGGGVGGSAWMAPLLPRDFAAPVHHRWPEYVTTPRGEGEYSVADGLPPAP